MRNDCGDRKVIAVIGGASGIGAALCRLFASQRAHLIIADSAFAAAQQLANELQAEALFVDVSSRESVEAMMQTIVVKHGVIDLVINSAGVLAHGRAEEIADEEWTRVFNVNARGAVLATMSAYRAMSHQGFGHIVNVASLSGLSPVPFFLPYVTTKYAVIGLSLALRSEAAAHGVKVSVVCPGNVATPMLSPLDQGRSWLTATVTAEYAALQIVRGIRRNRPVIVFPSYAIVLWWLERLTPWLSSLLRGFVVSRAKRN